MSESLNVDVNFKYASGFEVNASFEAKAGLATALVGPSGSGKSTILSLLSGLLTPLAGRIKVGDRLLFCSDHSVNIKPWNRNIGLLFQHDTLFPHLTVRKNLLFGAKPIIDSPWNLDAIVSAFEIGELLERKPDRLSGGQRDRVALGRTLLSQPDVLLLDEPLSSVEEGLRNSIFDFVNERVSNLGIPSLLVSHDSSLLSRVSAPVLKIAGGKLIVNAN